MSTFSKNKEGIVFPNCKERLNFKALDRQSLGHPWFFQRRTGSNNFFQNIKYQKSLLQDLVKENTLFNLPMITT